MTTAPAKISLTAEEVEGFINKVRAADPDKKVDQIQFFGLKLEDASDIPEDLFDPLTLLITPLLKSTSQLLVASVLTSFLPFYLALLPTSHTHHITVALTNLLPTLLEKLNDAKERTHTAAGQNTAILGRKCYEADPAATPVGIGSLKGKEKEGLSAVWERSVRDVLGGKGVRGKVEGMKVISSMRAEGKGRLPLKPWIGPLVDLLEDGDGTVRDQARETVVALLSPSSTPAAARSELKKAMLAKGVRKTISENIIMRVLGGGATRALSGATEAAVAFENTGDVRSRAATPAGDEVEVVYIASDRDLENEFKKMLPSFEGKETEQNWLLREKSAVRIRGMLRGQADKKYPESFVAGLKAGIMEGMSRTIMSLRTTVAQQACSCAQELAEYLKTGFDPFVESLMPILGKMAGFTKKMTASQSQRCVTAIIIHTSSQPRLFISHILAGVSEKNVQTRHYCTTHLKTFLDINAARSKSSIEATLGLLDQLETAVKKSLVDVNPDVRKLARLAFWSFHVVWTQRANAVMGDLDAAARKELDKVNPRESNGTPLPSAKTAVPARRTAGSVAVAQMVADKRRAKQAEMAAERAGQESPRVVSGPVPNSPPIHQQARSSSSTVTGPRRSLVTVPRTVISPEGSPSRLPIAANSIRQTAMGQQSPLPKTRSSTLSTSPTSSRSSPPPPNRSTPLRHTQAATDPSPLQSPASTSSTFAAQHLQTPTLSRKRLPDKTVGMGMANLTPAQIPLPATPGQGVIDEARRAQASQAESAAQRLLEFGEEEAETSVQPMTPLRPTTGSNGSAYPTPATHLLKTPVNRFLNGSSPSKSPWMDSPRQEAMTPKMLDKLKGRRTERAWWTRRSRVVEMATPLRSTNAMTPKSLFEDIEAIAAGQPETRNFQRLMVFSSDHRMALPSQADGEDEQDDRTVWDEDRLFARVFDGLMSYMEPSRSEDELIQALVLLWELVQNQWILFEDREPVLVDALFRLRPARSVIVHEATNSLISLLTEACDALFLLSVIRDGLDRYQAVHTMSNGTNGHASKTSLSGESARASGYLLGLTGLGMCILRLPREAAEVEGLRLESLLMETLSAPSPQTRQAANTLVLAIQCRIQDSQLTLSLFPQLDDMKKNLLVYFFERNGILENRTAQKLNAVMNGDEEEAKVDRVVSEMLRVMGSAVE